MRKGLTRLEGSVSADVKEVFFWGREVAPNDPDVVGQLPLVAPNQWPDASLPHFKQHILEYYQAVMSLGLRLLECIALGLDQNPDKIHQKYLGHWVEASSCITRPYLTMIWQTMQTAQLRILILAY